MPRDARDTRYPVPRKRNELASYTLTHTHTHTRTCVCIDNHRIDARDSWEIDAVSFLEHLQVFGSDFWTSGLLWASAGILQLVSGF